MRATSLTPWGGLACGEVYYSRFGAEFGLTSGGWGRGLGGLGGKITEKLLGLSEGLLRLPCVMMGGVALPI